MCGLSGLAGDVSFKEEKVFKALLIFNSVRGMDSTGAASVSRKNHHSNTVEFKCAKQVGPFTELFETRSFDKLFFGSNQVYIGHNRSKTVGEATRKNAHPFVFDDIIGAHNGTVDSVNKGRMVDGYSFKTDSEAIFNNIQVEGIEKTIGKLEAPEAYALTWYDVRDNTINFIRNDERPLCYAFINGGKTLAWSSEYGLLMAALHHEGFKPDSNPWEFTADIHYAFKIPDFPTQKFAEPVRKRYANFIHPSKKNGTTGTMFPSKGHTTNQHQSSSNGGTVKPIVPGGVVGANDADEEPDDGMIWGGHFLGYIPRKTNSVTTSIVNSTTNSGSGYPPNDNAAKRIVEEARKRADEALISDIQTKRTMTAEDWKRRNLLEKAELAHWFKRPEFMDRFQDLKNGTKIWQHSTTGSWYKFKFNFDRDQWDLHECGDKTPAEVPFKILDIQARHEFKHVGRPGKKTPYYRGFQKALLSQDKFEKIMQQGCANCERIPEWGNQVAFFTKEHDFLCEWCSKYPGLFRDVMDQARKQAKAA